MDDSLKSLKALHQMICVVGAAVLAFAMTPDRSKEYRAALHELQVLRAVPLDEYPDFVRSRFQQEELSNYEALVGAVRAAKMPLDPTPTVIVPIITDTPPQLNVRLRDYEQFFLHTHTAAIPVLEKSQTPFTERLSAEGQKFTQPISVSGFSVMNYVSLTIWPEGVRVADPSILVNSATDRTSVQVYLSAATPPAPVLQPIQALFHFQQLQHRQLALEWLRSLPLGNDLLNSDSLFPHLRPVWERVADMSIDSAALFLQERIEATTRGSLSLFGVSVDRDLVLWIAPAVYIGILIFFALHLKHYLVTPQPSGRMAKARSYPWIVCFDDVFSAIVSYATITGLPVISCALLIVNHGERSGRSTHSSVILTLFVLLLSAMSAVYTHRFRICLKRINAQNSTSDELLDELAKP